MRMSGPRCDNGAEMPPFNEARRDRLADTAIEILAREGARGLTHRAVDAEAGEPPGTTSRYFRTREALLKGAAERARTLHFADLAGTPAEGLSGILQSALTVNRSRHLAMLELFLESTRRPELRPALTEIRSAQIKLIGDSYRAAGIDLTQRQAVAIVATLTGLAVIGLTTPDVLT